MLTGHIIYGAILLAGGVLACCLTPLFKRIAARTDFMDRPSEAHKGHGRAVPLLGGAAMFSAWFICIVAGFLVLRYGNFPALAEYAAGAGHVAKRFSFLVLGAFLAVLLGLADDRFALKASVKFTGQFIIALIAVVLGGARLELFCPWAPVSAGISIFWFMLLMNSINFFDNMDGLAVGTVAIAMWLFATVAGLNGQYFVASFAALNCGVCIGFWIYNSNPASIFMGDSGSHFLGYLAAATSTLTVYFRLDQSLSRFPVLVPLFILAMPLFDTLMVVLIRAKNGKPFWIGDHNHISHRFVKMGLSRKRAVQLVHLMAFTVGLGVFPILWGTFATAALLVAQAILLMIIVTIMQFSLAEK